MEQERVVAESQESAPIFDAYRRGYDPVQVDRYIAEQRHRLDDALHRASESERKLAAAVGQLRELHRRVAMLEGEERSQSPSLDMLGERVQRILQEAWEGAYALRQSAERDVAEQREQASLQVAHLRDTTEREVTELQETVRREVAEQREALRRELAEQRETAERQLSELIESGQRRAELMRAETERRRQAYLERVEEDREKAVGQITYLYDQRQLALGELSRLQATIESTVGEMAKSPLGVPSVASRASFGGRDLGETEMARAVGEDIPAPAGRSARMPGLEKPISVFGAGDMEPTGSTFDTGPIRTTPPAPRQAVEPELRDRTQPTEYRSPQVAAGDVVVEGALAPPRIKLPEPEAPLVQADPELKPRHAAPEPEPPREADEPAQAQAEAQRLARKKRVFDFESD